MTCPTPTMARAALLALPLLAGLAPGEAAAWYAARGPEGRAVAGGPRGAVAVGPHGAAAVERPGYPAYREPYRAPYYRPPAAVVAPVPVYPGYRAPVAGAAVAGAMVGAAAGSAAAASAAPPPPAYAPPPPPPPLTVGARLEVLPAGCTPARSGSTSYYRCGSVWLRPYMEGASVAYVVVPPP